MRRTVLAVASLTLLNGSASAQRVEARISGAPRAAARSDGDSLTNTRISLRARLPRVPRRDSSWWVPLASAVLPGTGQALLGQDRFVGYLAIEGYLLLDYFNVHTEETRQRDRSRALARDVARALFPGPRPIGSWAYYESMETYLESGVFNRFPGGELAPEGDPATFNGNVWLLARKNFWRDPNTEPNHDDATYRRSINFYTANAVKNEFFWSWRNAQLEQDLFRRAIVQRNSASRQATTLLGVLSLNHLLSTVDAFVTLRLRGGAGAADSPTSLEATLPWAPFGRPRVR